MILLAIDTSAGPCAAAVHNSASGRELGRAVLDIGKGHAEHLMAVIDAALEAAGIGFPGLEAIAVSVGPGSFTGVRVGVSVARGLALALSIPAIGVTTLEAVAAEGRAAFPGRTVMAALDAGRGEINLAVYDPAGTPCYGPAVGSLQQAAEVAARFSPVLAGSAAPPIVAALQRPLDIGPVSATADILTYARLAAEKGVTGDKPKPVYLRAADAKPQAGFVVPRRDG